METFSDVKPFIGILSQLIGWTFFLIALGMFRNFIIHGFSMALAEFLFKVADNGMREKLARWLGNGEVVLDHLKELDKKLKPSDMED